MLIDTILSLLVVVLFYVVNKLADRANKVDTILRNARLKG